MSAFSITQGGLIANITDNSGYAQDGSSWWVNVCIDSGDNFGGQQVIKSRRYSNIKTAKRGAIKMMEALA